MHPRVRQEISLSLKTNTERRRDHCLPGHRQVMQVVMKSQRKADDQHGIAHFDLIQYGDEMIWSKA